MDRVVYEIFIINVFLADIKRDPFLVRVIFAKLFRILDKPNWNFMKRPYGINGQMGLLISTRRHHRIKIAPCRYIFVRRMKKSTLNAMPGRWRSKAWLMVGSISNLWPLSFTYQKWDRILDALDQRSHDRRCDIDKKFRVSKACVFFLLSPFWFMR